MYPKNSSSPPPVAIGAVVLIADGTVQTSGVTVRIKPVGVAEADGAGTTVYSTSGIVEYTPTQSETNYTSFILIAQKTGCIPVSVTVVTTASDTAGYAGTDQSKILNPTSTVALTGTTIATTQKVDVDTIKTNPVVNGGTLTFPTNSTLASTTNITAADVNVTKWNGATVVASNVSGVPIVDTKYFNGTNNMTSMNDFLTNGYNSTTHKVAEVLLVDSVSGSVGSVTGNVGGNVTGSVGSVAGDVSGKVLGGGVTALVGVGVQADLQTIKTQTVTCAGGVTVPAATLASTNNITTVGAVSGAVGSVTGNVGGNVVGSVGSVAGGVTGSVGSVAGDVTGKVLGGGASAFTAVGVQADLQTIKTQAVTCAGGVTVPAATLASTSNITTVGAVSGSVAGSVGSVAGDVSGKVLGGGVGALVGVGVQADLQTIKTQTVTCGGGVTIPAATLASTNNITTVGAVSGNIGGNVAGSVGSVTSPVTVGTNNDKTGYSLLVAPPTAAQIVTAAWQDLTSSSDFTTPGSIGKLLVDNIDGKISDVPTASENAVATRDVNNLNPAANSLGAAVNVAAGGGGGNIVVSVVIPPAVAQATQEGANITVVRGDTMAVTVTCGDLTSRTNVWFTVKALDSEPDDDAILQLSEQDGLLVVNGQDASDSSLGTVVVTDVSAGTTQVTVAASIMAMLMNGQYSWDVQFATAVRVSTPQSGPFIVVPDVTRLT